MYSNCTWDECDRLHHIRTEHLNQRKTVMKPYNTYRIIFSTLAVYFYFYLCDQITRSKVGTIKVWPLEVDMTHFNTRVIAYHTIVVLTGLLVHTCHRGGLCDDPGREVYLHCPLYVCAYHSDSQTYYILKQENNIRWIDIKNSKRLITFTTLGTFCGSCYCCVLFMAKLSFCLSVSKNEFSHTHAHTPHTFRSGGDIRRSAGAPTRHWWTSAVVGDGTVQGGLYISVSGNYKRNKKNDRSTCLEHAYH